MPNADISGNGSTSTAALRPVSGDAITLKLVEAVQDQAGGLTASSPLPMHVAYANLRENLRFTLELLAGLGFVVAEKSPDPTGQATLSSITAIFAAGRAHAPGRTAALQESWPALYETLSIATDQSQED